ncbi:hypothetical protein Tco_1144039 [Tanacetum coccineum]
MNEWSSINRQENPIVTAGGPGEYPKYLAPSDDDIPIEYQPLPVDASPKIISPGYIADSDPEEDPEEDPEDDPEEDPADYPIDGGDTEEEESFEDNVNDEEEDEAFEEEEDDEEEEEHLAPADSSTVPIDDSVPSAEDTEAFETDESAPTPPPPRLRRARISIRPQTPMAVTTKALIVTIPSPPLPLPSPPTHSPTYAKALLGYIAAMIQSRAASLLPLHAPLSPLPLPATNRREDVPEADVPHQKRLCLTALTPRFEVGESSAEAAARQLGLDGTHATDYGFVNTVDATPGLPMTKEFGYVIMDV